MVGSRFWIFTSGCIWLCIGALLFIKGLSLMAASSAAWAGSAGLVALVLGLCKGRFVLAKTVKRVSGRIAALPAPIRFGAVYTKSYWLLIGAMMGLGFLLRFAPLSYEARGCIDITIGSALILGAFLYFIQAWRNRSGSSPC